MALLSADIKFLLFRILAIRQPRRSTLPHKTIGREPGRGGLARAYSQDDWFAIGSLETSVHWRLRRHSQGRLNRKPMMKEAKYGNGRRLRKWGDSLNPHGHRSLRGITLNAEGETARRGAVDL